MARLGLFLGPMLLVLWIFCVVDVIVTKEEDSRHLPKIAWLFIVLLFPLVGCIAWLAAGRPRAARARPHERPAPAFPEYDRPGRAAAVTAEDDEEFLRRCRERAEEQRRRHRGAPEGEQPTGRPDDADPDETQKA